ncbi:myo-inositol 2-dehydrogenase [Rhizobium grahamii]|uniref:Myo-inositol 2-dehydrogenase n=1 Tax=Rhizobium grahamii TaxID=1120045 RepID=A0A5Q0C7Z5_9HYPH|nr:MULTISPECIES: Gfo/Idh/MocA family oxidoreductase [Rhizobium]QFY60444.1 myo-inositol 2-dehydrogenase [Rhizobium grahamii]QRM50428.1 myo-inositol 2-dehydrogenase [Rhizobium sp. BG6]
MSVRVAVIGAGIMGADHARIVAQDIGGAVLQVVCDASRDRAKSVADECGALDVSTDPRDVIRRDDVDAILVASPDETHASLCLASIDAGKPVLCEKPLSQSPEECRSVVDAEVSRGIRTVQLGFMRRFDPSYQAMCAALNGGRVGRPLIMHNCHRSVRVPANFTGQMSITNAAPHEFDVIRSILGTDYKAITVFQPSSSDASTTGAFVFMVLETTSGQLASIEVHNNASYGYDIRGELVGDEGSVSLSAPVDARYNSGLSSFERYPEDWRLRFSEAYRLQNKAFVDFVRTGRPSAIAASAWDGYYATVVAQAALRGLSERVRVEIETPSKPTLYQ